MHFLSILATCLKLSLPSLLEYGENSVYNNNEHWNTEVIF